MIRSEWFVGTLAIGLGAVIFVLAIRSFRTTLSLSIVGAVSERFGDAAARIFLAVIAALLLVTGVMILRDFRPAFAAPLSDVSGPEGSDVSPHR